VSVVSVRLSEQQLRQVLRVGPDARLAGAWINPLGPDNLELTVRLDLPDAPAGADEAVLDFIGRDPSPPTSVTWLRDGKPIEPPEA
jgi:hypothetical protein